MRSRVSSIVGYCAVGLLLLMSLGGPAPVVAHGEPTIGADGKVVRVYSMASADLERIRRHADFWGLRRDGGYALALASLAGVDALRALGLRVEVDEEETALMQASREGAEGAGIPMFPCYRTVEETFGDLAQLAVDFPDRAEWVDIGDSWEKLNGPGAGYDVRALVITNENEPGPKAPFILIAAIHAREYTTAEIATRLAEELVQGYGVDPNITWVLDHHEIHIVPQLNPDGRKRAEGGLFWRKNVNNNFCSNSNDRGIDLNRNSTFFWGGSASSGSLCSELFRGPSAASEPETLAIEAYMGQVFADQRGPNMSDPAPDDTEGVFISLHSFSELVLYPWEGTTSTDAPNRVALRTLGRRFGFFNGYTVCADCLGSASGTTVDQAYGEYGVAGYTFEVGTNFFQNCNTFENTVAPDNLSALHFAAASARRPYEAPAGPTVLNIAPDPIQVMAGQSVTVTATADDTRFDSGGNGTEPTQNIAAAYVTIDDPPWLAGSMQPLTAMDGAFDETSEGVTGSVDTTGLSAGRHLLFVVAEDADGNIGIPRAVFLDITASGPLFEDGFESGDTSAWPTTVP